MLKPQSIPVKKVILDNQMTILLKEVHDSPIITWVVLYRVGSSSEHTGQTGISHWVEHMMFKGTDKYPQGTLDREIERLGGYWNAMTSFDYTAYYETLPARYIELALDIESDRMINSHFTKEEVESERTVIMSERQGLENSPFFWLYEEVSAMAFRVHSYRHSIIGDMVDLHSMTHHDLFDHYRKFYAPNNAIGVAVGAFDSTEMIAKIRHYYGSLSVQDPVRKWSREEPVQHGEKRVSVIRPSNTAFVLAAYHAPAGNHEDWVALQMIDSILAGCDGIGNKTSRLYQSLVETELAISVNGTLMGSLHPHLYTMTIVVRDEQTCEACEAAMDQTINQLRVSGVNQAELDKAKKQAQAAFAYSIERITSQAFALARAENLSRYEWLDRYLQQVESVTLDDVHRVVDQYLRQTNRTIGYLIPSNDPERV